MDQTPDSAIIHYETAAGRFQADGRLRDRHRAVPGPAPRRGAQAVLARQAAGHPPAPLRRLGQDLLPVPATASGRPRTGIVGGGTVTDLPIRNLYYTGLRPRDRPRHPAGQLHLVRGRPALGLALAGGPDRPGARGRGADPSRRSARRVRGRAPSKMWHDDEFAGGRLRPLRPRPADAAVRRRSSRRRAGSTSPASTPRSTHAWIQGAIESGLRAAWQIRDRLDFLTIPWRRANLL